MAKSAAIQVELSRESLKAVHDIVADVAKAVALTPKSITVTAPPPLETATAYLFGTQFEFYGFKATEQYRVFRKSGHNLGLWFVESKHGASADSPTGKRGFWVEDVNDPNTKRDRDANWGMRVQRWGGVVA